MKFNYIRIGQENSWTHLRKNKFYTASLKHGTYSTQKSQLTKFTFLETSHFLYEVTQILTIQFTAVIQWVRKATSGSLLSQPHELTATPALGCTVKYWNSSTSLQISSLPGSYIYKHPYYTAFRKHYLQMTFNEKNKIDEAFTATNFPQISITTMWCM